MATDAAQGAVLLFGGESYSGTVGDTWYLRHGRWKQLDPAGTPGSRQSMGIAYDRDRAQVVMYGGHDSFSVYYTDTWVWDGVTWTCVAGCASP